ARPRPRTDPAPRGALPPRRAERRRAGRLQGARAAPRAAVEPAPPRRRPRVSRGRGRGNDRGVTDLVEELRRDLTALEDRFANDNRFSRDLYRALASNTWRKVGVEGHVALSWGAAEELVNELRARVAEDPLELQQTG